MDAKRRRRREGQRKDRKGDGGKDNKGLGETKITMGLRKKLRKRKGKKMERKKE
jgi:hypothetical protein